MSAPDLAQCQQQMLRDVEADAASLGHWLHRNRLAPTVLAALGKVPRHQFVPMANRALAYLNRALPIGYRQTISQPFIVALMSDLLQVGPDATVLEIGTGSGYQAAVLAELVQQVYSVECITELASAAQLQFVQLGYRNITVKIGNGQQGWPEHAPYDGIIVTAAAAQIPPALIEQLKPAARLVIPVGGRYETQWLTVVTKDASGQVTEQALLPVAFVPLVDQRT